MILYPAIDISEGKAVRLVQGDMEQATVFNDDPAAQAASFAYLEGYLCDPPAAQAALTDLYGVGVATKLEGGRDHPARSAPRRPKINQNRFVRA